VIGLASPIVGASRPEQVRDNATAAGVELGDDTVRTVEDTLAAA
jgi:aryl-alcohol dehydrogenase-like predicted oxidoreductase